MIRLIRFGWSLASIVVLTSLLTSSAWPLDYRSLLEAAPMYDAPSQKAVPLFVIARGTPVEVVVSVDGWCKVRDAEGGLAWVEKRLLGSQRTVQVIVGRAQIRSEPQVTASSVFDAEKNVLLDLVEPLPAAGWVKVRHRDGSAGHVRVEHVWGL